MLIPRPAQTISSLSGAVGEYDEKLKMLCVIGSTMLMPIRLLPLAGGKINGQRGGTNNIQLIRSCSMLPLVILLEFMVVGLGNPCSVSRLHHLPRLLRAGLRC